MTDQEKTELGLRTFEAFFVQFGDDVYAQILLEELLKGLIYEETLFIFGQQIEAGDETCDGTSERVDCNFTSDGLDESESTGGMAETDWPDYPGQSDAL